MLLKQDDHLSVMGDKTVLMFPVKKKDFPEFLS